MSDRIEAIRALLREKGLETDLRELAMVAGLPLNVVARAVVEAYQEVRSGDC